MKQLLKPLYRKLKVVFPSLAYYISYKRASSQVRMCYNLPSEATTRNQLFNEFIASCDGKKCLQIGVKEDIGDKFGPGWVSVDKFDKRDFIDYHYDIQNLEFENECFDAIVCWSILEHIPYPQKAISEMYRVLKPGGDIWVQLPFMFPYHEGPKDYWRVTPDGLRIWMEDFKEVSCACDYWAKTSLIAATYFHGIK